ncbi:hypothetical protein B4135_4170 [Caldibacillus debilis]|uniref:Uncharacterized protein n=1 Tax=Caldibacillus debilis TaxID=301148 RepID=A0A150L6V1_9BACI|nr:hypothetical protein B4135_4170 [Caldibacillus debilis]
MGSRCPAESEPAHRKTNQRSFPAGHPYLRNNLPRKVPGRLSEIFPAIR